MSDHDTYIPDEIWHEVTARLRAYPQWKAYCADVAEIRDDILYGTCKPEVMAQRGASSVVEAKGIKLAQCDAKHRRLLVIVEQIEDALRRLNKLDRQYVDYRWFQWANEWTEEQIARFLHVHRNTLIRRRRRIIRVFAERMGLL